MPRTVSRREFFQASGAAGVGLLIGVSLQSCAPGDTLVAGPPVPLNAWLRITPDDVITILVDRSEMGQGVATALPMLVAEELEADWSRIGIDFAPADMVYANPDFGGLGQGTGGSSSVREGFIPLRQAGAAAREVLITAAAATWKVDRGECRAEAGAVVHAASKRRLRYGQLVTAAAALPVPKDVPLKDAAAWTVIGTRSKRLDTGAKVDGSAIYGIDVKVPGMLVAVIERAPVFGGTVARFDATKARAVPGVRDVVQISNGIAVVADGYWPAQQGRAALDITWTDGANATLSSAEIATRLAARATRPGTTARHEGQGDRAPRGSTALMASYRLPFLAHATMEPMNCTAHVKPDGVEIWAPTQFQTAVQQSGAAIGGVPLEKVTVHTTYMGGGFGRRMEQDFVVEALEVSKVMQAPIKVIWSREDDMRHDLYRAASQHEFRGALGADGKPVLWVHRVAAPSAMARIWPDSVKDGLDPEIVEGAMAMPYGIPNVHVECALVDTGVPVGFWRSVNNSYNGFAVETFIDELAHLARQDPCEYRRGLLTAAPRHLAVLNLAAEKAGWGTPLPVGRGRGISVYKSFQTYVAQVAEVSVAADGTPTVHRVVCAVDCGQVVNPAIVEQQIEGSIVMGLTAALWGEITIDQGRVVQGNFDTHRMMRIREMPVVEVHILPSTEKPTGVGEPATPGIAPAVGNAIFALTGKRIRTLPIGTVA